MHKEPLRLDLFLAFSRLKLWYKSIPKVNFGNAMLQYSRMRVLRIHTMWKQMNVCNVMHFNSKGDIIKHESSSKWTQGPFCVIQSTDLNDMFRQNQSTENISVLNPSSRNWKNGLYFCESSIIKSHFWILKTWKEVFSIFFWSVMLIYGILR